MKKSPPTLKRRIVSYAKAVGRWAGAGRPVRDEGEVRRIFERLCRPRERFDGRRGTCKVCGCRVRKSGSALVNKIKMATEHCPEGKW
jgi:hypothetical protein